MEKEKINRRRMALAQYLLKNDDVSGYICSVLFDGLPDSLLDVEKELANGDMKVSIEPYLIKTKTPRIYRRGDGLSLKFRDSVFVRFARYLNFRTCVNCEANGKPQPAIPSLELLHLNGIAKNWKSISLDEIKDIRSARCFGGEFNKNISQMEEWWSLGYPEEIRRRNLPPYEFSDKEVAEWSALFTPALYVLSKTLDGINNNYLDDFEIKSAIESENYDALMPLLESRGIIELSELAWSFFTIFGSTAFRLFIIKSPLIVLNYIFALTDSFGSLQSQFPFFDEKPLKLAAPSEDKHQDKEPADLKEFYVELSKMVSAGLNEPMDLSIARNIGKYVESHLQKLIDTPILSCEDVCTTLELAASCMVNPLFRSGLHGVLQSNPNLENSIVNGWFNELYSGLCSTSDREYLSNRVSEHVTQIPHLSNKNQYIELTQHRDSLQAQLATAGEENKQGVVRRVKIEAHEHELKIANFENTVLLTVMPNGVDPFMDGELPRINVEIKSLTNEGTASLLSFKSFAHQMDDLREEDNAESKLVPNHCNIEQVCEPQQEEGVTVAPATEVMAESPVKIGSLKSVLLHEYDQEILFNTINENSRGIGVICVNPLSTNDFMGSLAAVSEQYSLRYKVIADNSDEIDNLDCFVRLIKEHLLFVVISGEMDSGHTLTLIEMAALSISALGGNESVWFVLEKPEAALGWHLNGTPEMVFDAGWAEKYFTKTPHAILEQKTEDNSGFQGNIESKKFVGGWNLLANSEHGTLDCNSILELAGIVNNKHAPYLYEFLKQHPSGFDEADLVLFMLDRLYREEDALHLIGWLVATEIIDHISNDHYKLTDAINAAIFQIGEYNE